MRKYHYEFAAYTDNLYWGRQFLGRSKNRETATNIGRISNKGSFIIEKVRVYD